VEGERPGDGGSQPSRGRHPGRNPSDSDSDYEMEDEEAGAAGGGGKSGGRAGEGAREREQVDVGGCILAHSMVGWLGVVWCV